MTARNLEKRPPIKVSIVEDAQRTREYLKALVGGAPGFICAGAYATAEMALEKVPQDKPRVLLLDMGLPRMSGLDSIPLLREKLPELEILVLTVQDDSHKVFKALEAGATGYLVKAETSSAGILEAIEEACQGGAPMSGPIARLVVKSFHQRGAVHRDLEDLTPREADILRRAAQGLSSKEISEALEISDRTVGVHLHHIYEKLHVHSRAAAAARFLSK